MASPMDEQPCSGCGAWDEDVLCPECRRTKAPTHAAAVSGCTGTGEDALVRDFDPEDSRHILNVVHRGQPFDALPGCTAATAVLEGVVR